MGSAGVKGYVTRMIIVFLVTNGSSFDSAYESRKDAGLRAAMLNRRTGYSLDWSVRELQLHGVGEARV